MQSNTNGQAVKDCKQTIAEIDWFANVGGDFGLTLSMPVSRIKSWTSATRNANSRKWENTTLEADNQPSQWLHNNHKDLYNQKWNQLVGLHKTQTIIPLKQQVWMPFLESNGLDPKLVHSFEYDHLGALMQASYRDLVEHEFDFFGQLLRVYAAGHFPCGWKGSYPSGTLLVY